MGTIKARLLGAPMVISVKEKSLRSINLSDFLLGAFILANGCTIYRKVEIH
ncbi:hypothetical protein NE683_04970 [Bariatricus massiliensis]|uniref:Uncharacterized protein n=1 Tax=Bariatricus massiliensis TaxID=1745713 RepID=A0ABS8DFW7_9FIRM|nr:hypothetical protein [Bariatricus massiliensis]MCB7304202.1 hypothetical protein [Bariatricus massiliensis]MCB7374367.1 hypothetical protein [Bariatricus massiliensis]MCB7387312.1 hypothetical protein [Bariatricus massiliensis]MCB7411474.1 hypothetical protein [Bariatricus massiliensis]MCQ5252580.1 hypothetical protein [Bariatricus massiliensis]